MDKHILLTSSHSSLLAINLNDLKKLLPQNFGQIDNPTLIQMDTNQDENKNENSVDKSIPIRVKKDECVYITLEDFNKERVECQKGLWMLEAESFGEFVAKVRVMIKNIPPNLHYDDEL